MTCENFHKITGLTESSTAVNMTATNSTNISSLDDFNFVLCVNPSTVVTGDPLPYTITINGASGVPLYNKYHLPIYTNRLKTRKLYRGAYVVNGTDTYIVVFNTPSCPRFATSTVASGS